MTQQLPTGALEWYQQLPTWKKVAFNATRALLGTMRALHLFDYRPKQEATPAPSTDDPANKYKLKKLPGTDLADVPGLPASFVEAMKDLGKSTAESVWEVMYIVPESFKQEFCPEHQLDPNELEKLLRKYVPKSRQDAIFEKFGNEWNPEEPEKPDEVGYNPATFPQSGYAFVEASGHLSLPTSITIPSGGALVFLRTTADGADYVKKGPTLPPDHFVKVMMPMEDGRVTVVLPDQPADTEIDEVYLPKASPGSHGEIGLQLAPMNPMCEPYPAQKIPYFID